MAVELQVESLDHLGLVAGVIDELGLVALTDKVLPGHPRKEERLVFIDAAI